MNGDNTEMFVEYNTPSTRCKEAVIKKGIPTQLNTMYSSEIQIYNFS